MVPPSNGIYASSAHVIVEAHLLYALAGFAVYLWDDPRLDRARKIAFFAAVVTLTSILASAGPWTTTRWGHDIAVFLDGGWRIAHGQRPYLDFSSSGLGPSALGFAALALQLAGGNAAGLAYMSAMAFAGVTLWAYWAAHTRLHTSERVCLALLLGCIASAPYALGLDRSFTGYAMSYNRWGYALLGITALIAFARPFDQLEPLRDRYISASAGVAVALLIFLKPTFGLAGLALIATAVIVRTVSLQRFAAILSGAAVTFIAFLLYLRFDIGSVISDLEMIGKTRVSIVTPRLAIDAALALRPEVYAIGIIGLFLMIHAAAAGISFRIKEWQWALVFSVVLGLGILLTCTNYQGKAAPLLLVLTLIMLSAGKHGSILNDRWKLMRAATLAAGLAGLVLPVLAFEALSIVRSARHSVRDRNNAKFVRFNSPALATLTLAEHGMNCPQEQEWCTAPFNGAAYVNRVNDGLNLLRAHTKPEETIGVFEQASLFSIALNRRPPRGWALFFAYNYTFSERNHLPASRVFHDANLVMVPKHSGSPMTTTKLLNIYGADLERMYVQTAESEEWKLYRRR